MPYRDLIKLQNAFRINANYLEHLPHIVMFSLASGLYFPQLALVCVWTIALARIFYSIGYTRGGPSGRIFGAVIFLLCSLVMLFASVMSAAMYLSAK